ncbi:MAG: hypothetical protein WD448_03490 [Woeseia sp.]
MSEKSRARPVAIAVGAALAGSFAIANVASADTAASPFAMTTLSTGYMLGAGEGTCGSKKDDKTAEGNCGGDKEGEGSCGADKEGEGSCGGDKGGEGSCGEAREDKGAEGKCGEGKCGEGKCGGAA